MDTLFLIGQIVLGVYFVVSGVNHFMNVQGMTGYAASKGLPMPKGGVLVTGAMLLLGGLGILFQMYLNVAYGLLIAFLVAAAFTMHNFWKAKDPQSKMADMIQFQKNLALASALLMLYASM